MSEPSVYITYGQDFNLYHPSTGLYVSSDTIGPVQTSDNYWSLANGSLTLTNDGSWATFQFSSNNTSNGQAVFLNNSASDESVYLSLQPDGTSVVVTGHVPDQMEVADGPSQSFWGALAVENANLPVDPGYPLSYGDHTTSSFPKDTYLTPATRFCVLLTGITTPVAMLSLFDTNNAPICHTQAVFQAIPTSSTSIYPCSDCGTPLTSFSDGQAWTVNGDQVFYNGVAVFQDNGACQSASSSCPSQTAPTSRGPRRAIAGAIKKDWYSSAEKLGIVLATYAVVIVLIVVALVMILMVVKNRRR